MLSACVFHADPSTWPKVLSDHFIREALSSQLKVPVTVTQEISNFLKLYLTTIQINGELLTRNWIRVSDDSVYCLPCCVYSSMKKSPWTNYSGKGYCDFNHALRGIKYHEQSTAHILCVSKWRKFIKNIETSSSIPSVLNKEMKRMTNEWKKILRGILDCALYLAKQNLAFCGQSDDIQHQDCGNFLALVKLLAKYYPPLTKHVDRLSPGKTSYLSPRIQNEFINRCGSKVREFLLTNVRRQKYFAIMVDSTPDVSKMDQLSFVIRSVECNKNECLIKESFMGFITTTEKTGIGLCNVILKKLEDWKLDIMDCRGQGYDNGANMSGKYNGVQAHITEKKSTGYICAVRSTQPESGGI